MSISSHDGHHHRAVDATDRDFRLVTVALLLITLFLAGEVGAAVWGNSLALWADAGHMLTDVGALGLSAWTIRLSKRPAQGRWTFGLQRAGILSAAINGITLVALSLLIAVAAVERLVSPHVVRGALVLTVACVGAVVNVIATAVLARANRTNLSIRGSYVHIVTDLYAFGATAIAGLVIELSHWQRADAVASLVVVALMIRAAWGLLRESGGILLQAAPQGVDLSALREHLTGLSHVLDVHDLHLWTVTSGSHTVSAHVIVEDHCFDTGHAPQVLDELQNCLASHFDIEHATFQLEPASHDVHENDLHP